MFPINDRPISDDRDLLQIDALTALSWERAPHFADLPWRLAAVVGSRPERTRLFEDNGGRLVAWATLLFPWHCLDYAVLPGPDAERATDAVFAWAAERLATEAEARDEPLRFFAAARPDDAERCAALERHGFGPNPWNWRYLRLGQNLDQDRGDHEPAVPLSDDRWTIRPLAGAAEIAAAVACHRAAFGSEQVTLEWRAATIRHPRYAPTLDLVAVGGGCLGWITPPLSTLGGRRIAQVEPLGVHPDAQRGGLGRALLTALARQAASLGAVRLEVDVDPDNHPARETYIAAGFVPEIEVPFSLRLFHPPCGVAPTDERPAEPFRLDVATRSPRRPSGEGPRSPVAPG